MPNPRAKALAGRPLDVDDDVAELSCRAEVATVELAVEDQAAADPGAEREHDHVVGAAARAEAVLRERRGVRVVLERNREAEPRREVVAEVEAGERNVHRGARAPRSLVDEGRDADAERPDVVVQELRNRPLDLRDERLLARRLRQPLRPAQDDALAVEDARRQLRAADVERDDVLVAQRVRKGGTGPRLP